MAKPTVPMTNVTKYDLPDGAVLHVKRPTNAVRRVLVEQPETNLRFLMEMIAAACITKMEFPAGYSDNAEATAKEFEGELKADVWKRLDELTLVDNQTFVEAFQEANLPTKDMLDKVVAAVKLGKAK